MAHEITAIDKVLTLTKAWHHLETIVPQITGFGWDVKASPLYLPGIETPVASHKAIVDDEGNLLSVAKSSYEIITNAQVFDAAREALSHIEGARIVSAGSVKGRKVIFLTVELDGLSNFNAGGDAHTVKLNLISSHDGTKAFTARIGFTRIVCANTVALAESEAARALTLYHTKNARREIRGMNAAIAQVVKETEIYKKQADALKGESVDMLEMERALAAFLGGKDTELSTRTLNQIEEIKGLAINGKGNSGDTRWDLFNGLTEYFTHEASGDKEKLFESSEFGSYADKKTAALSFFTATSKEWRELQKKGKELLAASL